MSEQVQQPNLTELTDRLTTLTGAISQHTRARRYLWDVFTGKMSPPQLRVESPLSDRGDGADPWYAHINMSTLPQHVVEGILVELIKHEEESVLDTWAELAKVVTTALEITTQIKAKREAEIAALAAAEAEESRETIPFPSKAR